MDASPFRLLAIAGPGIFAASLVLLLFVRSDLDPAQHAVSDYGNGKHRWVFIAGVLAMALGKLALARHLAPTLPAGRLATAGIAFLVLDGIATLAVAAAPIDAGDATTPVGLVHRGAATTAFVTDIGAFLCLSLALRAQDPGTRPLVLLGIAVAVVLSVLAFALALLARLGTGLAERATILFVVTWMIAAALLPS